jgi:hypothetical protein
MALRTDQIINNNEHKTTTSQYRFDRKVSGKLVIQYRRLFRFLRLLFFVTTVFALVPFVRHSPMKLRLLQIWILIGCVVADSSNQTASQPVHSRLWKSLATVNKACPKFVTVFPKHFTGLGDILTRILTGVAVAHTIGCTLVLEEPIWGIPNAHEKSGYNISIFRDILGVPIGDIPLKKTVINEYHPAMLPEYGADYYLFGSEEVKTSMPCNSMARLTSGYGCKKPNVWCFGAVGSTIQTIIRPYLDESIQLQKVNAELQQPLAKNKLNVVWHMRSGPELCLHCAAKDKLFFNRIHSFIAEGAKLIPGIEVQNIFIHLQDVRLPPLLVDIPNQVHYTKSDDIATVIRLFMETDVLITTGSSFSNIVSYFTPLFKPVVIEALDKDSDVGYVNFKATKVDSIIDNYAIIEGRSFRLDSDGNILHYMSDDLSFRLERNGAIKRITTLSY